MSHRTSLYLKLELLQIIHFEAKKRKISKNKLILKLLHSYAGKVKENMKFNKSIQYQEPGQDWTRINIKMEVNEYEFFLDIRKFMKLSLSLILYLAITGILLNMELELPKKNFFNKEIYGIFLDSENTNHISWKIIWSIMDFNNRNRN